jgi:hypothetical protein
MDEKKILAHTCYYCFRTFRNRSGFLRNLRGWIVYIHTVLVISSAVSTAIGSYGILHNLNYGQKKRTYELRIYTNAFNKMKVH